MFNIDEARPPGKIVCYYSASVGIGLFSKHDVTKNTVTLVNATWYTVGVLHVCVLQLANCQEKHVKWLQKKRL